MLYQCDTLNFCAVLWDGLSSSSSLHGKMNHNRTLIYIGVTQLTMEQWKRTKLFCCCFYKSKPNDIKSDTKKTSSTVPKHIVIKVFRMNHVLELIQLSSPRKQEEESMNNSLSAKASNTIRSTAK